MICGDKTRCIVGLFGVVGTSLSFGPQAVLMYYDRTIKGPSPWMLLVHTFGLVNWCIYGTLVNDDIIIGFNAVTIFLIALIGYRQYRIRLYPERQKKQISVEDLPNVTIRGSHNLQHEEKRETSDTLMDISLDDSDFSPNHP